MKQKFIGKWIRGFGKVVEMSIKENHKSAECKSKKRILFFDFFAGFFVDKSQPAIITFHLFDFLACSLYH